MLVTVARVAAVLGLALSCANAGADGLYKCKDAAGRITYSSNDCDLMGLTSAGEVKGKANVAPAFKPPPGSRTRPPSASRPASAGNSARTASQSAEKKSEEPKRRCFVVKTAKGTATRCNEVPPEEGAERK